MLTFVLWCPDVETALSEDSGLVGAGMMAGELAAPTRTSTQQTVPLRANQPIRIRLGGYGPPSSGFSLALKRIGERVKARFGDEIDLKYVYNILDLGYRGDDINWLVEDGVITFKTGRGTISPSVPDLGADSRFIPM